MFKIVETIKDYIEMRTADGQENWVATVKHLWDKAPLWVKSLAVATKLTLMTVGAVLVLTGLFGTGLFVLSGILGLWWVTHRLMKKGSVSKTLWQIWTILVVEESTVTTASRIMEGTATVVPVVENEGDKEQQAKHHKVKAVK